MSDLVSRDPSGGVRPEHGVTEERVVEPEHDALREALQGLRREIRSRFPAEREPVRRAAPAPPSSVPGETEEFDPIALFDELRERVGTMFMRERVADVDEFGMDAHTVERAQDLMDFLFERYFRVSMRGLENVPTDGPCLFVANRSGLLPYDGLMLTEGLARHDPNGERPRFLVADWLVTLPFAQPALARIGGVRACRENADRLLRTGRRVIAFPEGVKGAAKVFRERYRVKRFGRGGVVRAAIDGGVPLVPVGIVGAEEAHPVLFKAHRAARMVGLPFLPVTPTFPLLGPAGLLPLPTKWLIKVGEPIDVAGVASGSARDAVQISRVNEDLRGQVQALVNAALDERLSVWE